jgi:outer membrane protein TolC
MIAVRQSLNTMEMNMKSYYAAQNAVASAQKAYDIAQASYEAGMSTLTELNDAQLALTQTRLSEYQAIYNFVTAKAQLEQTIGEEVNAE